MILAVTASSEFFSTALIRVLFAFLRRDIRRELDDLDRFAGRIEDRVVAGLEPYLRAALADALVLGFLELAPRQFRPELPVLRRLSVERIDEHAVVLADDLRERCSRRWRGNCRSPSRWCRRF